MTNIKNYITDNLVIAAILEVLSKSKIQITKDTKLIENPSYFFGSVNANNKVKASIPIDTYGIINKNKLLLREPITGEQLNYYEYGNNYIHTSNSEGISILSENSKIFYFYEINDFDHKYEYSLFTNLKSKNLNIVFPNKQTIHLYSTSKTLLKKYIQKLSNRAIEEKFYKEIKLPSSIKIKQNDKVVNKFNLTNETFVGLTYQLNNLIKILLSNPSISLNPSENENHYINKLFFSFYGFFPNFLSNIIFKFLLRFNGSSTFCRQVLETHNTFTLDSFIFTNPIDDDQSLSFYKIGSFFPRIYLTGKNKILNDLLKENENIICSSNLKLNTKKNVIKLKSSQDKQSDGFDVSPSSYELLNLDNCFYIISKEGLILHLEQNNNFKNNMKPSNVKSNYSDIKQKSMDNFEVKNFKASLPKVNLNFRWPVRFKKQ